MTTPIYAIGDIHGQIDMLRAALLRIENAGGVDAKIVFLGDYVDRGPDSRAVIETLMEGQAQGRNWTCLKGNHDRMFAMFMEDFPRHDPHLMVGLHWLHARLGGMATLASYGVPVSEEMRLQDVHKSARVAVPSEHIDFINGLPLHLEEGDRLFVHAGIRTGVPLEQQTEDDRVWIRQEFIQDRTMHPWLVIHGHTVADQPEHLGNRVNLDTGAGYGRPLTAAVFEGRECWVLSEMGRVPLAPCPYMAAE